MSPKFHITTFGCQMNVCDSSWLALALEDMGWERAGEDEAEVFIVNTCSVREKPEKKVDSTLGRLAGRVAATGGFAAVMGCVAEQKGSSFSDRFDFVRAVIGTDHLPDAPEALERVRLDPDLVLTLTGISGTYRERPAMGAETDAFQAFVNIMQGCDNYCAYCIVPFVRGPQRSRAPEAVLAEVRSLADSGVREVTLLGQNVNSFGLDPGGRGVSFADLLRRVAAVPGLERLRFTTSHPKDIAEDVVRAYGELENLCPHLHLPLQSGSDRVLARMGRGYDLKRYLSVVKGLKQARPDISLTTDLIVGFPGETEEDFQGTVEIVQQVGYASSFSFVYSDRPPAAAADMAPKVPRDEALDRLARLQKAQDVITNSDLERQVGGESVVLFEGMSRKQDGQGVHWRGRDPQGRVVNVPAPRGEDLAGRLCRVAVTSAKKHSLVGEKVGEPW